MPPCSSYFQVSLNMTPHLPSLRPLAALLLALISLECGAQEETKKRYIESNWGLAWIEDIEVVFPGTSLLVGKQIYSGNTFVELQGGLAFPSILTAKMGFGQRGNSGSHISTGFRIFPLHWYVQTGFPTKHCHREVSRSKLKRLEKRGKTAADILCSEWVFSFELSPTGAESRNRDLSLNSRALMTAAKRWYFN